MPISMNHIKNDKRHLTLEYAGESFGVVYLPSQITPNIMAEMREANEDGNEQYNVDALCRLLISWEVEGDDGQPVPIEHEVLSNMASPFLSHVLMGCVEDMFGKKKNGRR
jgi:hypothetical protein